MASTRGFDGSERYSRYLIVMTVRFPASLHR